MSQLDEFTPGLVNAMTRRGVKAVHDCGFPMPRYPGRYPVNCPHCGAPFAAAPETPEAPPAETPDDAPAETQ